ncbi:MAG TPA: tetratricopeptide repeat protein [Bryobacteraceae bacterium]|jgi:tetratricopeptide (TPR) repeat protein|nr:tetratricopeptide repeat protein [Bryobacteraceae bacterium]
MPLFITGRVVMADGSPVPETINIKRDCGGEEVVVAYTDSGGRFSFQWGDRSQTLADVTAPFSAADSGTNALNGSVSDCELRAELAGYRSDSASLTGHRAFDNPNIGSIVLHRMENVEGLTVSATSFAAPPAAKKAYIKGLKAAQKSNFPAAAKNLENAVRIYPRYANAWLDLARVRMQMNLREQARDAYLKALEADDKLVQAQIGLGLIAANRNQWADAAKYLDSALRLDPVDYVNIWLADAIANYNAGHIDVAQKSVNETLKQDSRHRYPGANRLLGLILATRKDYTGAVSQLRAYMALEPAGPDIATVKTQLEQLETLAAHERQATR